MRVPDCGKTTVTPHPNDTLPNFRLSPHERFPSPKLFLCCMRSSKLTSSRSPTLQHRLTLIRIFAHPHVRSSARSIVRTFAHPRPSALARYRPHSETPPESNRTRTPSTHPPLDSTARQLICTSTHPHLRIRIFSHVRWYLSVHQPSCCYQDPSQALAPSI